MAADKQEASVRSALAVQLDQRGWGTAPKAATSLLPAVGHWCQFAKAFPHKGPVVFCVLHILFLEPVLKGVTPTAMQRLAGLRCDRASTPSSASGPSLRTTPVPSHAFHSPLGLTLQEL